MKKLLLFLIILFTFSPIVLSEPTESGLPYIFDSVLPKESNLEVRGNANIDLFTGAATYSYPLILPPGINSLQPQINLFYNSQNQDNNILGRSWTLSQSYIQRDVNYTSHNISDDKFKLVLDGNSYDLIYSQTDNRFFTKIENFFHIKNETSLKNAKGQYWILRKKDGTSYRFGFYNFSETVANSYNHVWRWNLDLINDTYGNSIFYNYSENPYPNDNGTIYLDKIKYNNDLKREINFIYESNGRPDLHVLNDNGNKIIQTRRLKEITINANNTLVRKYVIDYHTFERNNESSSFLANITEFGKDNITSFPSVKFEYKETYEDFYNQTLDFPRCSNNDKYLCFAGLDGSDYGVRLTDVNGDGLVDIVKAQSTGGGAGGTDARSDIWINNRTGWYNNTWSYPHCTGTSKSLCFVSATGADIGIRLTDVNGDGLTDIVKAYETGAPNGISDIWINNGTGWNNQTSYYPDCETNDRYLCFVSSAGADYGTSLIDVNNDNLVDIVKAQSTGAGSDGTEARSDVWINNGTGWNNNTVWYYPGCEHQHKPLCFVTSTGADYGVRVTDVNGDGLVDIIKGVVASSSLASSDIWINNGSGWYNGTWNYPECVDSKQTLCVSSYYGVRFGDINRDGLTDILKAKEYAIGSGPGVSDIWVNNGTGWNNNTEWKYPNCNNQNKTLCFVAPEGGDYGIRLADADGDGTLDIIRSKDTGNPAIGFAGVWNNNNSKTDLLRNITTEFGGIISIDYEKSTSFNNTGNDNIADMGFNAWVVSNITYNNEVSGTHNVNITYNYNYSGGLYDYTDKEFRGFNYVEEKIGNKVIKHWFHQDDAKKGREYLTETLDNQSNTYKKLERTWINISKNGYYIIELIEESELTYDGTANNPKIKNITYSYDGFGNINFTRNKGDISDSNDDKYEYFNYVNNSNLWIVNKIKNYSLFNATNTGKIRETLYSYDALAYGTAPIKGSLTKKEEWLNGGSNPVTKYGYNASNGNLVNETDPNGRTTNYSYGIRDRTNTFIDRTTNAKGHRANYWYDLGTGNMLSETDFNSFIKNYSYDLFSRKANETLPYDSIKFPTTIYEYTFNGNAPNKIKIKRREQNGTTNTLDEWQFYDGFGRYIQTKKEAENSQQIVIDVYYDAQGRIEKQSNPYFTNSNENYNSPNQSINTTRYAYDILDRIINITNPDGTKKGIIYDHWNITLYDENINKKDYQLNAYKKITNVREHNNGNVYLTTYNYDTADNLISIIDAKGNAINYTYDTLGRKIRLDDFDLGIWKYAYDNSSNLIQQNDSRGNNITILYDELNRKISENSTAPNKTYVYDLNKNNTLTNVTSGDIKINYLYDNRLRKIREDKIIDNIIFPTQFTYDSLDREVSNVLPDKNNVNYTYNNQGLLGKILDIVNISYNQANNILGIWYNNLLTSNYTYKSDNLRLIRITTSNLQGLNYSYDSVGNVKEINDSANLKTTTMYYDNLDRLLFAKIVDTQNNANHTSNFTYNEIGNILQVIYNNQNYTYSYNNNLAHAPSRITIAT